jgi:translation initiation factor IF-2
LIAGKREQTPLVVDLPAFEEIIFTVSGKGSIDVVGTLFEADEFGDEDDEMMGDGSEEGESISSVSSAEAEAEISRMLEERNAKKAAAAAPPAVPKPAAKAAPKPAAAPVSKEPPKPKPAAAAPAEPKKRPAEEKKNEDAQPNKKAATEAPAAPKYDAPFNL